MLWVVRGPTTTGNPEVFPLDIWIPVPNGTVQYMNKTLHRRKLLKEITVIDRRNSKKPERSKHHVILVRQLEDSFAFLADWQFPVPACKRRYFLLARELAIEECGKVPGQNIFQFTGVFI
jgi:hypothetical protein